MNNADRKTVLKLLNRLTDLREALDFGQLRADLEAISEDIGSLADSERDKFDNMSQGLQDSERGQALDQAADALSAAQETVDEMISNLEDADKLEDVLSSLEEAAA